MNPIKNVIFDFGGVIISIDYHQALKHCADLGLPHPEKLLDPYTQSGIFGDLESGKLSEEAFRKELSVNCRGKIVSMCSWVISRLCHLRT